MKHLILFIALLMPAGAFAINLTGFWKEVKRTDSKGTVVPYSDTLRIQFKIGNEYLWMRPNTFQYRGTYSVNNKSLDLGMKVLQILSSNNMRLILKDEDGITYDMVRYEDRSNITDNSAAQNSDRADVPVNGEGVKNYAQLRGKWDVYKRTNGGDKRPIDYTRIVRTVVVPKDGKPGQVYAAKDMDGSPSWTIDHFDNNVLYCKGKDMRQLRVIKCSEGELILQEGDITYFFKQFKM